MNGRKQGKNPQRGLAETHHISAVAHHFLAGTSPLCGEGEFELTVAAFSWRPGPLASYAVAGLAATALREIEDGVRTAAPLAVFLEESSGLKWSAASFLGEHHLLPAPRWAGSTARRYWPSPDRPPAGARPGERSLRLFNLGQLDDACLDHLESLPDQVRPAAGVLGEACWLVWCLFRQDLTSRRAALALGRLAALAKPAGVELLVYPDGGTGPGLRAAGGRSRVPDGRVGGDGEHPWRFSDLVVPGAKVTVTRLDVATQGGQGGKLPAPSPPDPFLPILTRIRKSSVPFFRWTGHGSSL